MRKTVFEVALRAGVRRPGRVPSRSRTQSYATSPCLFATALPITARGPPPEPPQPSVSGSTDRLDQKKRQAELLEKAKQIRLEEKLPAQKARDSPLRKRFWKDVHVREVGDGYQIYLDSRPVRTPNKSIVTVPKSKIHLAHAIAIEWDLLVSAQQALKGHNIPMTSIVARAQDILEADSKGESKTRNDTITVMTRYLDTDTLLCWAPERSIHEGGSLALDMEREREGSARSSVSLRQQQINAAREIISHLNATIWPGVEIKEVLSEDSILPQKQSDATRSIIQGWMSGLPAFELAALERATLASKSLLIATRLLIEWSEEFRDVQSASQSNIQGGSDGGRFDIEAAAHASTIEVRWQTGMWGEVEDTHDVENEDIRRQLGSAILLIMGSR